MSLNMIVVLFQRYEFLISGQRQYLRSQKERGVAGVGRDLEASKYTGVNWYIITYNKINEIIKS